MSNTTNTTAASVAEDLQDVVSKALRRAWQLGQTYWRQADSDSLADHRRSELTQESFGSLVDETRAALAAPAQAAPANEALKNAALPWPWKTDAEVLDDAISAIEGQNRLKAALRSIAARTTPAASPAQADEYPELPIRYATYDAWGNQTKHGYNAKDMHAYVDADRAARGAAQAAPVEAENEIDLLAEAALCERLDACLAAARAAQGIK